MREDSERPVWLAATVAWLAEADLATATRSTYAGDLGVPAAERPWRASSRRAKATDVPQAFLRWCEANGVDPLRDVDHEVLRTWARFAREAGDKPERLRRRVAVVSEWYGAMARRRLTTITFPALMTHAERRRLHRQDDDRPAGSVDTGEGNRMKLISDGRARAIASEYHTGQASLSYSFTSTGTIADVDDLVRDLERGLDGEQRRDPAFLALVEYIRETGTREAVPGWSGLWADR
jgi:hypothetical protein